MLHTEKYDSDRIFRFLVSLFVFGIIISLTYYLRNVLVPFVIAFVIAYVLDPAVDKLEERKIPRIAAILIVFLLIALVLILAIIYFVPHIVSEFDSFSEVLPIYIEQISAYFEEEIGFLSNDPRISEYVDKAVGSIEMGKFVERALGYVRSIFSQLLNVLYIFVALIIIVMYAFFLLRDIDRIKERWHLYIPGKYRETVREFVRDVSFYTTSYFRGQLIIVSILGILFAIGFSIVDIRLAIVFGLTAGFLNLIPNFGTITAIFPAVMLAVGRAAEDGSSVLYRVIAVLVVFLVVQIVQEVILTPTIQGKRTGLRPATILFSIFVWGKLLGFLGILLAVPLTCLTKVYFSRYILKEDSIIRK